MPGPVFLIAQQRSGTNLLRRSLASTPWFIDRDEVFHDRPDMGTYWTHRALMIAKDPLLSIPHVENQNSIFLKYLDDFADSPNAFTLIDVKYNSLHHLNCLWQCPGLRPHLFTFLAEQKIPVIHLVRHDILASYVSILVANELNIYVSQSDRLSPPQKLTINTSRLLQYIRESTDSIHRTRRWLTNSPGIPSIELKFEDLLNDSGGISRKVLCELESFLNIPSELRPLVLTRKMITRPYWHLIQNFDSEVVPALIANGFEYLLPKRGANRIAA